LRMSGNGSVDEGDLSRIIRDVLRDRVGKSLEGVEGGGREVRENCS